VSQRIAIRVSPGARTSSVVGRYADGWKVRVTAPADQGKANDAVCKLVANVLGIAPSNVQVISGATNRSKLLQVEGVTAEEIESRFAELVGDNA
jgi:uncharacterized protein (TIGR00251 family)